MNCQNCNNTFNQKDSRQKFCNRSCAAKFNNKQKIKSRPCSFCGQTIFGRITNKKCCADCFANYKQLYSIQRLKSVQNITLSKLRRIYDLNEFHAKIRGWSRQTYSNYNKPNSCKVCGYKLHCDICHIKPISDFAETTLITEVNHIDNLIALCPNHHWEFDNKIITLN